MKLNREVVIEIKENAVKNLIIIKHMLQGALALVAIIAIVWSLRNIDVIVKTVKYPEAVREMEVTVKVTKTELISPIAK